MLQICNSLFDVCSCYYMTAPPKAACHPNPCLNGGICKETGVNQDFDCICPNPRFKGRFCDGKTCVIYVNLCLNVILGYNLCQVILVQDLFSEGHSVLSWISIDQAKLHFSFGQNEVNFTKAISGKATKTKICNISATSLFLFRKIAELVFVCLLVFIIIVVVVVGHAFSKFLVHGTFIPIPGTSPSLYRKSQNRRICFCLFVFLLLAKFFLKKKSFPFSFFALV